MKQVGCSVKLSPFAGNCSMNSRTQIKSTHFPPWIWLRSISHFFLPKTSTTNERPKRKQVPKGDSKPAPLKILPAKLKCISPTSSPVASTKSKVQKVEPIRTPPYAKRIENMLGTWYQQIRVGTSESSTLLSSPSCKLNFTRWQHRKWSCDRKSQAHQPAAQSFHD